MTFHFSLIALCAFGLFVPDPSHAQRLINAPVVSSHRLDPNDGTRPIHERVGDSLVARPGVYPYAYGPTLLFDPRDQLFKMWAGVGWNGDTISYKQAKSLSETVANIRRYKGARPVPAASPAKTIAIPGNFAQWADVKPVYLDDLHDTTPRDHDGVPGAGRYTNKSGRNDLDTIHVAHDATHLFFHVTGEKLGPASVFEFEAGLRDTRLFRVVKQ